jgi:amino acid adenylation domain-containing protein
MEHKIKVRQYSTIMQRISLETWSEIVAFCERDQHSLSTFFKAVWSVSLHRYLEKDVLHFAVKSDGEQFSGLNADDQIKMWRVTITPHMVMRDLFENPAVMKVINSESKTESDTTNGLWLTRRQSHAGEKLSQLIADGNGFSNYDFLLCISLADEVPIFMIHHPESPQLEYQAQHLASTVRQVAQSLVGTLSLRVKDVVIMDQNDIVTIPQGNQKSDFEPGNGTIADAIHQQALRRPDALAVDAWDGKLTYRQLDNLTNRIAVYLRQKGVTADVMVPACFEKSVWAVVGELAIAKAGGAFVPMDPAQPQDRLRDIVEQTNAVLIVTSAWHTTRMSDYGLPVITISSPLWSNDDSIETSPPPRTAGAHSAAYVFFTSGSTGVSKGCVVSHNALGDIARHCEALHLSPQNRVLQFASYTFGVSLIEIFCALASGASIFIASEQDRLSNLMGYMREMKINWAFLTPSTVNAIDDPALVPQLETLILAGEPMGQHHIDKWASQVHLYQAYGLTEWAGICAVSARITSGSNVEHIGLSSPTADLWLADPLDHNKLMPIGAVAELLIAGPSLAREYLNNPRKTAETFIDNPSWLQRYQSRRDRRAYKTGDLVQYQPDGSFRYIARKDTQVKIRGKRLELSEVEYCVARLCPTVTRAIAEAVVPDLNEDMPILIVLLFYPSSLNTQKNSEGLLLAQDTSINYPQFRKDVAHLKAETPQLLPEHMVPALYLPLGYLPLTITGKIDRRHLRETMRQHTRETLEAYTSDKKEIILPSTDAEMFLHRLFAKTLNIPPHTFGIHNSFLQLGGDSIKAMRLASFCRNHRLSLTVTDIMTDQTIHNILTEFKNRAALPPNEVTVKSDTVSDPVTDQNEPKLPDSEIDHIKPTSSFTCSSRIKVGVHNLELLSKSLSVLEIPVDDVEEAFPCSFVQEGILLSQARQPSHYQMRFIWEITSTTPEPVDVDQLQWAWLNLIKLHPMLRSIFVEGISTSGLAVQVTLIQGLSEVTVTPCKYVTPTELSCPNRLLGQRGRQSLPRLTLYPSTTGQVFALLDINHAVTDATSMSIMIRDLVRLYGSRKDTPAPRLRYSDYISYLRNAPTPSTLDFWKLYLAEASPCIFPRRNLEGMKGGDSSWRSAFVELGDITRYRRFCAATGITLANLFKIAWSLVLSAFTASAKVCFGYMTSGRDLNLAGIEDVVGPFINMLVCYLDIHPERTLLETLQVLQSDFIKALPNQRVSLAEIRHALNLANDDPLFNTTMTFPPQAEEEEKRMIQVTEVDRQDAGEFAVVVEVMVTGSEIRATIKYWTEFLSVSQARSLASTLNHVLSQIIERPEQKVREIQLLSAADEDWILRRNHDVPQVSSVCVNELIDKKCNTQPLSDAVHAWDGSLTYKKLQELSNNLASNLVSIGVTTGSYVPLCLSRSYWTPVAMLAVIKAGAAFCLFDPSHPLQRLQEICNALGQPRTIITSTDHRKLAAELAVNLVVVEKLLPPSECRELPTMIPTDPVYIVFTSGSTGQPKGVVVEHQSYSTNAQAHVQSFRLSRRSRVLQFSGYSFDVSIFEHLTVLIAGGCICIPSETDRFNKLADIATQMKVDCMFLTPSVARLLQPEQVPSLKTLVLVGEPMSRADVDQWAPSVHLMNGYGPAEATVLCSVQPSIQGTDPQNIGWPISCVFWVTSPDNPHQLLPVGAVGELLVEGPILAKCYFNDPAATTSSFIQAPVWLQYFRGTRADARAQRVYRTGDLVQHSLDGSIRYVGRMDTQAKLRGQRLELVDIEHHVKRLLPDAHEVIADVLRAGPNDTSQMLIAFVARPPLPHKLNSPGHGHILGSPDDTGFRRAIASIRPRLQSVLPNYMVPTVFFPLNIVPLTKSGKTDRRCLRQLVTALSSSEIDQFARDQMTKRPPVTAMERRLQVLFAEALALEPVQIGANDHFFQLRGDSISAMILASKGRQSGLAFVVADVFAYPILSDLAQVVQDTHQKSESDVVSPFALLREPQEPENGIFQEAMQQCHLSSDQVEDMYPCTALQAGMIILSSRKIGMYIGQFVFDLVSNAYLDCVQTAWQAIVDANPILRTRIIQTGSEGLWQVVERGHQIIWHQGPSDDKRLADDLTQPMKLGQPLVRFSLVCDSGPGSAVSNIVLTMHHAIYDHWSLALLLHQLDAALQGTRLPTQHFSPFIRHLTTQDPASAKEFWSSEFAGVESSPFPKPYATTVEDAEVRSTLDRSVSVSMPVNSSVTLSNAILLAWAVVVSAYTDCEDVTFGLTVAGRSAPVPEVDKMTGPTIAAIPFRIRVEPDQEIETALAKLQLHLSRTMEFEQTGLQNIRKMSPEAAAACEFQTHIGIQPALEINTATPYIRLRPFQTDYSAFASYPLVLVCGLKADNTAIDIHANFCPSVISHHEMATMLDQFINLLHQVASQPRHKIGGLDLITQNDMKTLRCWNNIIPAPSTSNVHDMVLNHVKQWPDKPAIVTTQTTVTFQELDLLSKQLARQLEGFGLQRNSMVPLYFEKSIWPIIAMIAVLRTGATCVNIDTALPASRVRDILQETNPSIVLVSPSQKDLFTAHAPRTLKIIAVPLEAKDVSKSDTVWTPPVVSSSTAAFIIFTSGSTGKPKGIVMEHGNLTTSIRHHSTAMEISSTTRSLHFAGYAFDASIYEIFTTLANGGTVYAASEHERINELAGFIRRHQVSWVAVTPSVINLLRPEDVPSLRTVVLGGEAVTHHHVKIWAGRENLRLINGYGPAEATICAAGVIPAVGWRMGTIGPILGAVGWVTVPSDPERLSPLGAVGELLIEGPVVTRGYLHHPEHAPTGFISPPSWLQRFRFPDQPGRLYRSGDLVQYTADGWVRFAGRRDTQVKLRGQRIELGEVEHHVSSCISDARQVVAEVISRGYDGHSALLFAFVLHDDIYKPDDSNRENIFALPGKTLRSQISQARRQLLGILPPYMVPAVLVPVSEMPYTKTGKIDRKRLRGEAARLSSSQLQQLEGTQSPKETPSTDLELRVRQVWAHVLVIDPEEIGIHDNFFSIGGESISAMQVVAQCRSAGLLLSVADLFRFQNIAALATHIHVQDQSREIAAPVPFSLIDSSDRLESILALLESTCGVDHDAVEDIYPCTALQEGLIALTAKNESAYVNEIKYDLPSDVDLTCLEAAWLATMAANPVLRTRIIQLDARRCYQVVLSEDSHWQFYSDMQTYRQVSKAFFGLGRPLVDLVAVMQSFPAKGYILMLRIHHAIYDGWSLPILLNQIQRAYDGHKLNVKPYAPFIDYLQAQQTAGVAFWQGELASADTITFPTLPSPGYQPMSQAIITRNIPMHQQPSDGITLAVRLRLAWALVQSQYTGCSDVVFGVTSTGRAAPVPGIEQMTGPTQATIPMRVQVDSNQTIIGALHQCQSKVMSVIPYEQFGMQNIMQLGDSHAVACQFQTLLIIQPVVKPRTEVLFTKEEILSELYGFNPYALMLICQLSTDAVEVRAIFDANVISEAQIDRILKQFGHIVQQLSVLESDVPISHLEQLRAEDLADLTSWNHLESAPLELCVHDAIQGRCDSQPDDPAVCAWDGKFSYRELDALSSTLALHLQGLGAGPGLVIPLYLEKSRWVPVAMLGVIKAGSAFVLLEPAHPVERLQQICLSIKAEVIVASTKYISVSATLGAHKVVTLSNDETEWRANNAGDQRSLATSSSPRNTLYIVFTSGSTGQPKGVVVEHRSFYLNAMGYIPAVKLNRDSRVFQFSGFAFDLIILEVLSTLMAGGCICIPSEQDRSSRIAQVLSDMKVNWMFLTPSVARTMFTPRDVPTLRTLVLGGEAMREEDIITWSRTEQLMNAYGPAECSVITTVHTSVTAQSGAHNIGRPWCSAIWITHPKNSDQLLPVGAVGEILIEGPILAQGYLNDSTRTDASFIPAPHWLHLFRNTSEPQSRLYRTGDMGQYQADGSIVFLGRRDGQVKLRGQRIELAEVEHHVQHHFPRSREVIADVIQRDLSSGPVLVALVACGSSVGDVSRQTDSLLGEPGEKHFLKMVKIARSELARTLPHYMVPTFFLPLIRVPLSSTGKADRRLLHKHLLSLSSKAFVAFSGGQSRKATTCAAERMLQTLFGRVLSLDPISISPDANFFQIGGDSIVAMKLVSEARLDNVQFTVAEIFTYPVLSDLAKVLRHNTLQPAATAPFTLLPGKNQRSRILQIATDSCGIEADAVADIYPCTPLQEGLMALTSQKSSMYIGQLVFKLAADVDIPRLQAAWQHTVELNPILRTRLIQSEADGLLQVVVKPSQITWTPYHSVKEYLNEDLLQPMTIGQTLARFAVIQPQPYHDEDSVYMVLTLHHTLYDGWSLPLLLRQVDMVYNSGSPQIYPFTPFIQYVITNGRGPAAQAFWNAEFAALEAPPFPALRQSAFIAQAPSRRGSAETAVPIDHQANANVTLSNVIRLAWAVVVSAYTDSEDVLYGVTVTGRNAPVPHIEDMASPTFATVPFRVRLLAGATVYTALSEIQKHATEMIPFEQTGLQYIRKMGPEAAAACNFRSQLGVQLSTETIDNSSSLMKIQNPLGTGFDRFASYPLVVICNLSARNDIVRIHADFDLDVTSTEDAETMLAQFAHVLQQLCKVDNCTQLLGDIELVSPDDCKKLQRWNGHLPGLNQSTLHDLVLQHVRERPTAVAVSTTSQNLTFGELDTLSSHLAHKLVSHGVKTGHFIPICFEKSIWPIVGMLAVLRAGAACFNVDPVLPSGRVREMLQSIGPHIALSSHSQEKHLKECAQSPLLVIKVPWDPLSVSGTPWIPPRVEPNDAAFLIFTSGSTGTPKGIILEHVNLSTSIYHHSSALQVDQNSRSLHFAGYAWDASVYEIFTTLVNGGCVCIPSEKERTNDLAGFIRRSEITWATLTPSVMALLDPDEVPNLRAVSLGGEAISYDIVNVWADRIYLINGYGPAEATICAAGRIPAQGWEIGTIGPMLGSVGWVTMPSDPSRLAPLGAVGELLIEGPVVARGYLNQEQKTRAGFIQPPAWLSRFRPQAPGRMYRSGDLVQLTKNGWIRYVGRKDTQVKLRGQRIELGEVEHHIRSHTDAREVVAEVIIRGAAPPVLVAFILYDEHVKKDCDVFALPSDAFCRQAQMIRARMQDHLPSYMVPTALLPLQFIPSTPTGKTDRKRLREAASQLSNSNFARYEDEFESPKRSPSTDMEVQLQSLWARVLKLSVTDIGADDGFFRLGGNSIDVMMLVTMARKVGIDFSVTSVFQHPKLCDLAIAAKPGSPRLTDGNEIYQPCSLLNLTESEAFILDQVAHGRPFEQIDVIDVLPTTQFQREQIHRDLRHYFMVHIPGPVDVPHLETAIQRVVEKHEILRTVFVPLHNTLAQVTLRRIVSSLNIIEITSDVKVAAKALSQEDCLASFTIGTPYFKSTLLTGLEQSVLIFRISHAQYDGVSFPLLYSDLTRAYQGHSLAPARHFSEYMRCRIECHSSQAWSFWREFLQDSAMTQLGSCCLGGHASPILEVLIHRRTTITLPTMPEDITIATVFKAAWGLTLARHTGLNDIVFGQVVHGRSVPLDGVETILGPCVNIIPVRVPLQREWRSIDLLNYLQDQHASTQAFDTVDFEDIVSQSTSWPSQTRFGSIAQHQNMSVTSQLSFDRIECTTETHSSTDIPDTCYAVSTPQGSGLMIEIVASSHILSTESADRLLAGLSQTVLDLSLHSKSLVTNLLVDHDLTAS